MISTSQPVQSVQFVSSFVVVRDAAAEEDKNASRLTSSLLIKLTACSDFRCMPALVHKHEKHTDHC